VRRTCKDTSCYVYSDFYLAYLVRINEPSIICSDMKESSGTYQVDCATLRYEHNIVELDFGIDLDMYEIDVELTVGEHIEIYLYSPHQTKTYVRISDRN
jgi:hypothetical protein